MVKVRTWVKNRSAKVIIDFNFSRIVILLKKARFCRSNAFYNTSGCGVTWYHTVPCQTMFSHMPGPII